MRRFSTLLKQQLWQMLIAPSTYIAAFLFVSFMGAMYLFALVDAGRASSETTPFVNFLSVFWIPVLFMVPLLTMRSIAEERRTGTLGALMTTPITAGQIVFAKFLACYFFYVLIWALTFLFPLIALWFAPRFAADPRFLSVPQVLTGYAFVFVSGAMYIAAGIFASSLTRTTLVAGMLSFCMLFLSIIGAGLISKFPLPDVGWLSIFSTAADYVQTFRHFDDFVSSALDTRPFFFYLSTAALLLGLTTLATEVKNS